MKTRELLSPAGSGVHTVHTKKDFIDQFQKEYYGDDIEVSYKNGFPTALESGPVILGIPFDNGAGILRGANWGPLHLRSELKKANKKWRDLGDIKVIPHLLHDKYLNEETLKSIRNDIKRSENLPVSPLSCTRSVSNDFFKNFDSPLLSFGGDHSVSRPLVESFLDNFEQVGIIHFDAHTDLMPSRLGIDQCFATWAYHISERISHKGKFHQIGIRSSGRPKEYWESNCCVTQHWANEVKDASPAVISKSIIDSLDSAGVKRLYISIDIDVLDASCASMCGTPEKDGLMPHQVIEMVNLFANKFEIGAIDLVELAPYSTFEDGAYNKTNSLLTAGQLGIKLLEILEDQCR